MHSKLHNYSGVNKINYYKSYHNTLYRTIETVKSNYYNNIFVQNRNEPD